MLPEIVTGSNWLSQTVDGVRRRVMPFLLPPVPLERPNLAQLARPGAQLPRFVAECAVARKYLELLGPLNWDHFPSVLEDGYVNDDIPDESGVAGSDVSWNDSSAAIASITLQKPVRVAIHASRMMPET